MSFKEQNPLRTEDFDRTPTEVLIGMVYQTDDPRQLRKIAKTLFTREAQVLNDNDEAPFIRWPAINQYPRQRWLPILLAKTARVDFQEQLQGTHLLVLGPPASATWYIDHVKEQHIFPDAEFPRVFKEAQVKEMEADISQAVAIEVPSYVHNRQLDGTRGTQTMYFLDKEMYRTNGKPLTVLILDDAIAQGITTAVIAQQLKEKFSVDRVLIASPMAKLTQGGKERLTNSPYVDGVSTIVDVVKTHGKGMPIDIA